MENLRKQSAHFFFFFWNLVYNGNLLKTLLVINIWVFCSPQCYLGRQLRSQAEKAIMSISKDQRKFAHLLLNETFELFDAIVKPILCYASCIWGTEHCDIIESFQSEFCKKFLGVNIQ